jgi:hypothetical protein
VLINDDTSEKNRHRISREINVLVVALLVGGLLSVVGPSPPTDASCAVFKGGRSAPDSERGEKCGSGAGRAPTAGGAIAVPRGSATPGALTRPFGSIARVGGTLTATVFVARAHHLAGTLDAPWPSRHSRTARRHAQTRYHVYQLYFRSKRTGNLDAYKYGITRVGAQRPRGQVKMCEKDYRTRNNTCRYRWIRRNVVGFYRARVIETSYCVRYELKMARRPYGMQRCL